ncbi:MAG: hypothetical protein IPK04_15460 [Bdellovibrionales bacterium]|nr:hypothetical protein [Bdellovibrionales bacterium]
MQGDHCNNRLIEILDFSKVQNVNDVLVQAQEIASELLLNWQIRSSKKTLHSIEAVEFYLIIPGIFEDDANAQPKGATHRRPEQLSQGRFYVHTKSKAGWSLPIFNRHGIDITCGNGAIGIYGGILLRHLGGHGNKDGSGRALRVLLRGEDGHRTISQGSNEAAWSDEEREILKKLNQADIFENELGIELVFSSRPIDKKAQILSGKRIGVDKTRFANVNLRFFIH